MNDGNYVRRTRRGQIVLLQVVSPKPPPSIIADKSMTIRGPLKDNANLLSGLLVRYEASSSWTSLSSIFPVQMQNDRERKWSHTLSESLFRTLSTSLRGVPWCVFRVTPPFLIPTAVGFVYHRCPRPLFCFLSFGAD
jgi:hypothetical protein